MHYTKIDQAMGIASSIRHGAWVETVSGKQVDLLNPALEHIDIADIAHHLARINRFSGATAGDMGISVAAHSFFVSDYLFHNTKNPLLAMHGLLHDAHEAYIGDITSPVKQVPGMGELVRKLSDRLQTAVLNALHIPDMTELEKIQVKRADILSLAIEARLFMSSEGKGWHLAESLGIDNAGFIVMSPKTGTANFLAAFDFLNRKIKRH
jgi:hypothetical protein